MDTKFFFLNVRGLNDPDKHRPFCDWHNSHQPLFGSILESHIKYFNLNQLMSKLCQGWKFTSNHLSDDDGRIVLIWHDPVSVGVLHQTSKSITCQISIPNTQQFTYTAVYASNLSSDRTYIWVELLMSIRLCLFTPLLGCLVVILIKFCITQNTQTLLSTLSTQGR